MNEGRQKQGWNRKMVCMVGALLLLALLSAFSIYRVTCENTLEAKRMSSCRNIIVSIICLGQDGAGDYVDAAFKRRIGRLARSSNEAFRELFRHELLDDERDFGGRGSLFVPDGEIGEPPDFSEALRPGENQWAMTTGASISSSGNAALIYENPAEASWPPKWNLPNNVTAVPGCSNKSGNVIVGRNDGSVSSEPLAASLGGPVTLRDAGNLFPKQELGMEVLNVER